MASHKFTPQKAPKPSGQISIFVIFIFPILFVLFAMTLNIAMLIHHKINLQNSVDLSAYYMAQQQAKILNTLAHQNYQIRQAWKLFTFRYRVVGGMSVEEWSEGTPPHPANSQIPPQLSDENQTYNNISACVMNYNFFKNSRNENLCRKITFEIPRINPPRVVAGFLAFNIILSGFVEDRRNRYANVCDGLGRINWDWLGSMLFSYWLDSNNRLDVISRIANTFSRSHNFPEITGDPVGIGVRNTFEKNLTRENQRITELKIFNSMAGTADPQGALPQWLPPIPIYPALLYSREEGDSSEGCTIKVEPIQTEPTASGTSKLPAELLNFIKLLNSSQNFNRNSFNPTDLNSTGNVHLTLGVEKNPWYMVYAGVHAKTEVEPVFSPLGSITLNAKAYAKPFGGRMGPWAKRQWGQNNSFSTGERLDPFLPLSENETPNGDSRNPLEQLSEEELRTFFPNYSRYPNDQFGLSSHLALKALASRIARPHLDRELMQNTSAPNQGVPSPIDPLYRGSGRLERPPPPERRDYKGQAWTPYRKVEVAAVIPDLFDLTYYTVLPNYSGTYLQKLRTDKAREAFGFGRTPLRGDLGSFTHNRSFEDPQYEFTVRDQIELVRQERFYDPSVSVVFYKSRNWKDLLTGWVSGSTSMDYILPSDRFMECVSDRDDYNVSFTEKLPYSCAVGGRSGYSVKFVSEDFLLSPDHFATRDGERGQLKNAPPEWSDVPLLPESE